MSKLLRVTARNFVAGAEFKEVPVNGLCCCRCAPIIRWMAGLPWSAIEPQLERRRLTHEWVPTTNRDENLFQVEMDLR